MDTLDDLVPAVKRAVAVPGTFIDLFPNTSDEDLLGALLDGMAEAQLDGFLNSHTYDEFGAVDPALTNPQGALVVLWTSARILENEITNRRIHVRYDAKGTSFEEDQGASVLVERLKGLRARKDALVEMARYGDAGGVFVADLAFMNAVADYDERDLLSSYSGAALRTLVG